MSEYYTQRKKKLQLTSYMSSTDTRKYRSLKYQKCIKTHKQANIRQNDK